MVAGGRARDRAPPTVIDIAAVVCRLCTDPAGAPAEGLGRPDAGVRHDIDAGAAGTRLSQEREESAAAEECGLMLSM